MSTYSELDDSFNIGTPKFIHCRIEETLPYSGRSGGTYIYPWFDPETEKNGGFFVPIDDESFDLGKGRPSPPHKKLRKFGKLFRTSRHLRTQPTGQVLKGYYCKLERIKPTNSLYEKG